MSVAILRGSGPYNHVNRNRARLRATREQRDKHGEDVLDRTMLRQDMREAPHGGVLLEAGCYWNTSRAIDCDEEDYERQLERERAAEDAFEERLR